MLCASRNHEIPHIKPVDFCVGCEENNPDAFKECLKRIGGIRYTFCDGTKITLIKGGKQ